MGLGHSRRAGRHPAHDPLIATSTVLLLTIVSALAGLIPAQRASRTDPMLALRQE
jgi:ABC-type lipoprotein release transport system permease subunit